MTLHDEVEIEDMEWNEELQAFTYQCPCGDLFQISLDELAAGVGGCRGASAGRGGGRHACGMQQARLALSPLRRARQLCTQHCQAPPPIFNATACPALPARPALPAPGEEIAKCPSCSLYVRVIYDPADFAAPAGAEAEAPLA